MDVIRKFDIRCPKITIVVRCMLMKKMLVVVVLAKPLAQFTPPVNVKKVYFLNNFWIFLLIFLVKLVSIINEISVEYKIMEINHVLSIKTKIICRKTKFGHVHQMWKSIYCTQTNECNTYKYYKHINVRFKANNTITNTKIHNNIQKWMLITWTDDGNSAVTILCKN